MTFTPLARVIIVHICVLVTAVLSGCASDKIWTRQYHRTRLGVGTASTPQRIRDEIRVTLQSADEVGTAVIGRRRRLSEAFHLSQHRLIRRPGSCWSRREEKLYRSVPSRPSRVFVERLQQYQEMHARCVNNITDWEEFFKQAHKGVKPGASVDGCQYTYWIHPHYAGLGNNLLSLVSAFVFSLLTNRALLIAPHSLPAQLLCEPFAQSSWIMPLRGYMHIKSLYQFQPHVHDFTRIYNNGSKWGHRAVYATLHFKAEAHDWTFFCEDAQSAIASARFIALNSEEYFVPGLLLVPSFEYTLHRLFPDRLIFFHAGRFLLHPANYLWQRIARTFQAYMKPHSKKVGVQVRTFYRQDWKTNPRIVECAVNVSGYLPRTFTKAEWQAAQENPDERMLELHRSPYPRSISLFLTSLSSHHFEYMLDKYSQQETVDGTVVALHSEGHEGLQKVGAADQAEKALMEMWLLSFSDHLLTSDASSFGYVAVGLAGVRPYSLNVGYRTGVLNWHSSHRPVCAPAHSEPCFLAAPKQLKCGNQPAVDLLSVTTSVQQCRNIGLGIETSPIDI